MLTSLTIISGGQTGADRTALSWAIAHGIAHGGWCPKGRLAEDGPIDACYRLKETPTESYAQRTEWNVRDSDATVIFSLKPALSGGSQRTLDLARKLKKPCLVLTRRVAGQQAAGQLRDFIARQQVEVLNIAGPRASEEANIGSFVTAVLDSWWVERLATTKSKTRMKRPAPGTMR